MSASHVAVDRASFPLQHLLLLISSSQKVLSYRCIKMVASIDSRIANYLNSAVTNVLEGKMRNRLLRTPRSCHVAGRNGVRSEVTVTNMIISLKVFKAT
ncbi:hypothetical protein J6590_057069 [Homalodisca vitripennis]|nr:hypothetical protein J6590_057069 [Homalodisca vitripennis]